MKRALVMLMSLICAGMAMSVQAANVSFNPGAVALTVEPGKSAMVNVVANADSESPYMIILQIGTVVTQGNLPAGWLQPADVSLVARGGGAASSALGLAVNVPAATPAGKYSAVVKPVVARATEPVFSSDITVTVDVVAPQGCDGALTFENVKVGPDNIWAPSNTDVEIDISGTVVVNPGCEVEGYYTMESNNGPVAGNLVIDDGGNFALKIPVTLSKNGKDKDGTVYNGMLTAVDAEGNKASQEFFVTVNHDRGGK